MVVLRTLGFGLTLTGFFALITLTAPTRAQSLNVGENFFTHDLTTTGTATVNAGGTTVSGNYSYYNASSVYSPLEPSRTYYSSLDTYNTSTATVTGGQVYGLTTHGKSTANVSGGVNEMESFDSSQANILAGTNIDNLDLFGKAAANISGGSIFNFDVFSESTALMSGGQITNLTLDDNSAVTISAGQISNSVIVGGASTLNISGGLFPSLFQAGGDSLVTISGGVFSNLYLQDNSTESATIDLLGSNLKESDLIYTSPNSYYYVVTGLLQDSATPFTADVDFEFNGLADDHLEFNGQPAVPGAAAVPEASTTVSFGLLMALGLGSGIVAARKKRASASACFTGATS